MIERIRDIIANAKYLTLTIADQGGQVQITATVRPKDGADPAKPIQVRADWQIADALLVEALNKPPKAGKTEVKKPEKKAKEEAVDLFAGENFDGQNGPDGLDGHAGTEVETRDAGNDGTETNEESHE